MTWFDWAKEHLTRLKAWEAKRFALLSNFTPCACQVMGLAQKEAERLNHNFLGTEHLLLGLININRGVAINVLRRMDVNLEELRRDVEKHAPAWPPDSVPFGTPYTPRTRTVIALARKNAKVLCHDYLGTEHLLLGLLTEGGGVGAQLLKRFNVELERTREMVLDEHRNYSTLDVER